MHALSCSLCTIYNSQGMKTTEVSTNRWTNKEIMVCVNNGILPTHKKEWNFAIYENMEGSQEHYAEN